MSPIKNIKPLGFQWETLDPFLFCVHHDDKFPMGNSEMGPTTSLQGRDIGSDFVIKDGFRMYHGKTIPGFPGHPHRGFETITVVREGIVDHADSQGASGRYGNGDVQWMTAGKGLQHSEMFPLIHEDKENPMELFQIWLNLPKKNKMVEPHFKMLWSDLIPIYTHTDENNRTTRVEIIAGQIENLKAATPPPDSWAADETNEVAVWNIKMEAGAKWVLPKASEGINRTIYLYKGSSLTVSETKISNNNAAVLHSHLETQLEAGESECRILLLQGKAINEPVVQYGPFVMNSQDEIRQAFDDYRRTEFGGWPWPRYDQVHDRNASRFAKHANGTKEIK
jgi:redox-sensitive bicupin YhaK (pirin superfamily)